MQFLLERIWDKVVAAVFTVAYSLFMLVFLFGFSILAIVLPLFVFKLVAGAGVVEEGRYLGRVVLSIVIAVAVAVTNVLVAVSVFNHPSAQGPLLFVLVNMLIGGPAAAAQGAIVLSLRARSD